MARRLRREETFIRFYFHQPYVFGLVVAAVFAAIAPGDWAIKLFALATAAVLSLIAAYVNFRALIRRDRDAARSTEADEEPERP